MEEYRLIKDFNDYAISNLGNVKSYKSNKEIQKTINIGTYKTVTLSKNGVCKPYLIHRLIATAFIENPENKPQVNHINGNKHDNSISNLEWCTNSENQKHAYRTGLQKRKIGELSHRFGIISPKAKKVIYLPTGEIYDSIDLASKKLNITYSKLYKQLTGINKNKIGIYFV